MKIKVYNIVVAAGKGNRFGSEIPKQFCLLKGKPVLVHTIERIKSIFSELDTSSVKTSYDADTILVLSKDHIELWNKLSTQFQVPPHIVVTGGSSRWESVKNAIEYVKTNYKIDDSQIITIHDGARPIIDVRLFMNVLEGVREADGCIPTVPVVDSLRQIDASTGKSAPIDRDFIRAVQTPQAFHAARLIEAYRLPYKPTFTDDASVMAEAGFDNIRLSEGNPHNIKITLPTDLEIGSIYL